MRIGRMFSLAALLAPVLLTRVPSDRTGLGESALLLSLVVLGVELANPAGVKPLGWRSWALAAFLGLILVPPSSSAALGELPPWLVGISALGYVAYFFAPTSSAIPWSGAPRHTFSVSSLLRWLPPVGLCAAVVFAASSYGRFLPSTVAATWEVNEVVGVLAAALWLGAVAALPAGLMALFQRRPTALSTSEPASASKLEA